MRIRKTLYSKGVFLNRPGYHSDATILSSVAIGTYDRGGEPYLETTLRIRDCNSTISIALDGKAKADYNNAIAKLDKLLYSITHLKKALTAGRKLYEKELKIYEKKEAERKVKEKKKKLRKKVK